MTTTLLRILIATLVLITFLVPAYYYGQLPAEIPIHFNAAGEADGFGNKSTIWLLPILNLVNLVIIYAITTGSKFTSKNKRVPLYFAEILGLYVMLLTAYIGVVNVYVAIGKMQGLGAWFLPFVGVLTLALLVYLYRAQRKISKETKNS